MKKVLIGICDIGNGHVNRQIMVIKELLKKNFKVVVAISNKKKEVLNKIFPEIEIVEINIPWITCNKYGIDFNDCLEKYQKNGNDYFLDFLTFCNKVNKIFDGKPDFVISDYEPNVAQYSYANNVPLICMEQQSKFLYLKEMKINNFSINEEFYRLNYFFPKTDFKIISSFFDIDIKRKNVYVVPPIIDKLEKKKIENNKVVVYFSPYCDDIEKFKKILDLIKQIKELNFIVYTNIKEKFNNYNKEKNITFKNFSSEFKSDFGSSLFVISSSGHQLISEAIYLDIPLYLFPLDTYEQNYNCLMVEKFNLGKKIEKFDLNEFYNFYNYIDLYVKNIKKYKTKKWKNSWEDVLSKIIKKICK